MIDKEFENRIDNLTRTIGDLKRKPPLADHQHNGFDATRVEFGDIEFKKVWVHHTIVGTAAATAANYGVFYIVPFACTLTAFKEVHQTAGTDAGAVTLDLEKLTGTQALDAGAVMLASTLSLKATINSVQTATLTNTLTNRNLVAGDRLALKDAGTLTAVANVTVMVELQIKI